jgi:trans-2-enoyl-CoA reductase
MVARVLRPEGKGFIFLDAHPAGCAATVDALIGAAVLEHSSAAGMRDGARPRALVVAGHGFDVPGVDYSKPVEVDVPWPATPERPS